MIEGKEFGVTGSALTSRPQTMICPLCEGDDLHFCGSTSVRCDSCTLAVEDAVLRTLEHIAALPENLGKNARERGHPEMRRLLDEVFHCPACGWGVTPTRSRLYHIRPSPI